MRSLGRVVTKANHIAAATWVGAQYVVNLSLAPVIVHNTILLGQHVDESCITWNTQRLQGINIRNIQKFSRTVQPIKSQETRSNYDNRF